MKLAKNSLGYKIAAPILILILGITIFLLVTVYKISDKLSEDFQELAVASYSGEIKRILDTEIESLTAARLLGNPVVVESKKRAVSEAVMYFWNNNGLEGIILDSKGGVVSATLERQKQSEVIRQHRPGGFHFETEDGAHLCGHVLEFTPWGWTVITATKSVTPVFGRREVAFLLPIIAAGSILMGAGVLFILDRNFRRPISGLISKVSAGHGADKTGVAELDTMGDAINNALARERKKANQCELLHNLAVSIHEITSVDDVLKIILEKAGRLIEAELAAIVLYDEKGGLKKLVSLGTPPGLAGKTPQGKGILEAVRLSLMPLRIDDISSHPAFSGALPEGHPQVHNVLGYPIFSDEGRPIGALYFGNKPAGFSNEDEQILQAISADAAIAINKAERITELKRFKQVIDSAFDIVIITDSDGVIEYVNPAFEALSGYSRDEALGKTTRILRSGLHPDEFYNQVWSTVMSGSMWRGELVNRKRDGSVYHASAIIFKIVTENGVNIVSIQRDITQEKRLYEQLLRAQKMEAIGTLAGGIAHEFNNLLAGILGYAEIMLRQTREGDPFFKPASIIHQAAKRGSSMARKILLITRKEKLEARPVNLNEIVQDTVDLLQKSLPKNIEIIINLKPGLPLVKADPTQMQQVVMNLSMNASDAMPDGGRLLIETAVVGVENELPEQMRKSASGLVRLSVSDTGMGIDMETQRRIFDPFFTTKETGKGTGLGLFIVHSVVNNHGGYINLYSEPEKGTRFNVYLPFTAGLVASEPAAATDLTGSGTILVVDDEPHLRELCKDMLQPLGYRVLTAENGEEGIRVFREKKDEIDMVILDMVMPKMGGSEVFQALKLIKPDVKAMLFSGYSQNGFAGIDALLEGGAKGFIQKPFTLETMAGTIKRILSE